MDFKLGENQIDFLIKHKFIKLNEWRFLRIKFNNEWVRDWYYIGNMSKLTFEEQELVYKNRVNNLKNNKNYYIENPL